jgi:hypothetical protein
MVGIAEETPRQLAPSVGSAMTGFLSSGRDPLSSYSTTFESHLIIKLEIIAKPRYRRNQVRFGEGAQ